ncbi:Fpg/Nei family DNA glycosylase [Actinomadura sp. GC306]|uniref:DNA-formamidopyrimidine glycosylase family protein n=1 Tax=Actinomadura sp. GC306 TaxID=2530367 RepID=UPI00104509D4|nr:DNA-formamidopyrimidine glycosylase family protein [Actinomadura sp. GC306]TDC71205.1 Fpg/Nei family DNA glycosylase [Actinomadura sp. GC306]
MPEGDVVWLTARHLREALAGRRLTRSDFRVPRFATADLRGRTVLDAVPRGKHLLVRVEGGLTVHTHLMMDGRWRIRPAGPVPRDHRVRLVLANAEWQAAGYSLGLVELLRTAEEDKAVGHLGPDLLDPAWNAELAAEAVARLGERPGRPIGEALLDQTRLAGIGNVYKAEILFLRGVGPWTPAGDVPDLPAMVELAHRLLDANKERHGHITTGDLGRGREHWVYGRAGRPCRRCGTRVERAPQGAQAGERVTFWCPHCQP